MNLFDVTLLKVEDHADLEIEAALLHAWRTVNLLVNVRGGAGAQESIWRVWADDAAMAGKLIRHLPGVMAGTTRVTMIQAIPGDAAPLPRPPHEGVMALRQLRGLALDDVFPHYDNDDMGLEERFHFLWDVCLRAEAASNGIAAAPVARLRQAIVALARAIAALAACDPADEGGRRALEQRAVWLSETGIDPEPALRLIRESEQLKRQ